MLRKDLKAAVFPALSCVATLTLTACTSLLYDDRCGLESRNVVAFGVMFTANGDTLGRAQVDLAESEEEGSQSLSWMIAGERLRRHISSARLVPTEAPESSLLSLTGGPAEPDIIIDGMLQPYIGPVGFNQLFERARTGALSIVLETDLGASHDHASPPRRDLQRLGKAAL